MRQPTSNRKASPQRRGNEFAAGALVVLSLGNPREKFWGVLLSLAPEGVSLSGVELASFDNFVALVKSDGASAPPVIFFPMHRVEKMELDLPGGTLPSIQQRFTSATGVDISGLVAPAMATNRSRRRMGRRTPRSR